MNQPSAEVQSNERLRPIVATKHMHLRQRQENDPADELPGPAPKRASNWFRRKL
jgi:hypothetical protein